jgi:hypothetical protein
VRAESGRTCRAWSKSSRLCSVCPVCRSGRASMRYRRPIIDALLPSDRDSQALFCESPTLIMIIVILPPTPLFSFPLLSLSCPGVRLIFSHRTAKERSCVCSRRTPRQNSTFLHRTRRASDASRRAHYCRPDCSRWTQSRSRTDHNRDRRGNGGVRGGGDAGGVLRMLVV